jgi:hypothetical protein
VFKNRSSDFESCGRELRNASGPEEKKTLERQIKDQDDLINRYQADLTKRGG